MAVLVLIGTCKVVKYSRVLQLMNGITSGLLHFTTLGFLFAIKPTKKFLDLRKLWQFWRSKYLARINILPRYSWLYDWFKTSGSAINNYHDPPFLAYLIAPSDTHSTNLNDNLKTWTWSMSKVNRAVHNTYEWIFLMPIVICVKAVNNSLEFTMLSRMDSNFVNKNTLQRRNRF